MLALAAFKSNLCTRGIPSYVKCIVGVTKITFAIMRSTCLQGPLTRRMKIGIENLVYAINTCVHC